jgi:hypothetical protein
MTFEKFLAESKSDYTIYHNSFTEAVDEMVKFSEKNGYTIDPDEMWNEVSTRYPRGRPAEGKTHRFDIKLAKNRVLHAQVFGMGKKYELNMYIG